MYLRGGIRKRHAKVDYSRVMQCMQRAQKKAYSMVVYWRYKHNYLQYGSTNGMMGCIGYAQDLYNEWREKHLKMLAVKRELERLLM